MQKKRINNVSKSSQKSNRSRVGVRSQPHAKSIVASERESDLAHIEQILSLMSKHAVSELEWEKPGERIKLRSGMFAGPSSAPAALNEIPSHALPRADTQTVVQKAAEGNPAHRQILSPFVGTFYRSASPASDPYVKEGQAVKNGDVLCIVEAMKLMNEIDADFACRIVSILVENGQPVEFGEPLFVVEA